jgi:regulator of protease activity HflC (stomatin/prohibitin superfamily)
MTPTTFSTDTKDDGRGAWAQAIALSFRFLFLVVGVLGVGWLVSNCRIVRPDDRAIVLRLGVVVREAGPGLLVAAPRPFEYVMILPAPERQLAFQIKSFGTHAAAADAANAAPVEGRSNESAPPAYTGSNESRVNTEGLDPVRDVGLLVTGDMSLVYYDATLFYRITDPQAYVLAGRHLGPALERIFQASAVSVTGSRDIDAILVARPELQGNEPSQKASRETLRSDLVAAANARLKELANNGASLGIVVNRVDVVPTVPDAAKAAFNFVLTAVQQAEKSANDARTVAEKSVQGAYRTRDRLLSEAQAKAGEEVNGAKEKTAPVSAITQGAQGNTSEVENNIFRDRIGSILNAAGRLYTTDQHGTSLIVPGAGPR